MLANELLDVLGRWIELRDATGLLGRKEASESCARLRGQYRVEGLDNKSLVPLCG